MTPLSFAEMWYYFVIMAVVSYFIGCFNFAVLIAKLKHKDVRKIGSGNPGTMNMSREFGLKIGLLTFFLDVTKGAIPAVVSYFIFRNYVFEGTNVVVSDVTRYFCGTCAVIGHIFPVTMGFKGGKGIASTFGMFWACMGCENPWFILVMLALLFLVVGYIALTEWGSMGSLIGVTGFSIWQVLIFCARYTAEPVSVWLIWTFANILLVNCLTWVAHRKNLIRLFSDEEHHTSVKKLSKGKRGTKNM